MHDRPPPNRCWMAARPGVEAWSSSWSCHSAPRHSHDAYQISLTRSGLGRFALRVAGQPCPPGGLALIGPGEAHATSPLGPSAWAFDTLYLDEETVRGVAGRDPTLSTQPATDGRLAARFARLHRAVVGAAPAIEQDEYLVGFVHALDGGEGGPPRLRPQDSALIRVREFLDECPEAGVSLADLASLADLSPSHLSRSFRREFGLPPHAYLVQARVRRARSLLRRGMPIVEVAARVGFADQAHLTRHFRRLVGITPGLYRPRGRNVQDPPTPAP